MIGIKKLNLIQDLSANLVEFHEKMNSKFFFAKQYDFYAYEIFDTAGLLVLFLYDKQKYLDKFCQNYLPQNSYVFFNFKNIDYLNSRKKYDSGYTFVKITAKHNLNNEQYLKILKFLTTLIYFETYNKSANNIINIDFLLANFVTYSKINSM